MMKTYQKNNKASTSIKSIRNSVQNQRNTNKNHKRNINEVKNLKNINKTKIINPNNQMNNQIKNLIFS